MSNKGKILIAGAHKFPDGGGAASRCMYMLAKGFTALGRDVTVVSVEGSLGGSKHYTIDGFDVRTFLNQLKRQDPKYPRFLRVMAHVSMCWYLVRSTVKKDYTLLVFYGPVIMFPLVAIIALIMRQHVAYLMADIQTKASNISFSLKIKFFLSDIVDFFLARLSNEIIVLGTSLLQKRYATIAPGTKQIRILAPTDTNLFNTGNSEFAKNRYPLKGRYVVSYAGRIDMLEGVHVLISAIAILAKKYPKLIFVIAGQESNFDKVSGHKVDFKKMVIDAHLSRFVIFTGLLSLDEVIDLYAASDILVMPKIDHPMNRVASPIKIAEYLAAGQAVVSSNICEIDTVLTHMKNVVLCTPGDDLSLSSSIERVMTDIDLKRSVAKNAREIAIEMYDCSSCASHILLEANLN